MTHDFPCVIPEVHKEKSTSSIGARPMSFASRIFLERSFRENKSDRVNQTAKQTSMAWNLVSISSPRSTCSVNGAAWGLKKNQIIKTCQERRLGALYCDLTLETSIFTA